jgi:hypothetical protein
MEGGEGASIMDQLEPEDAGDRTGGRSLALDDERPASSSRIARTCKSQTDAGADRALPPVGFDRQAASTDVFPALPIWHA